MSKSIKNILFSSAIRGIHNDMNLNPITLNFPNKIEKEFRKYHFKYSVDFVRIALLFSMALYLGFNILDYVVFPGKAVLFLFIRLGIIIPSAAIILGLRKVPFFKNNWQPVMAIMIILAALGIISMILFSDQIYQQGYYAGLILVMVFNYVFARLRFVIATITGLIVFVSYLFTELIFFNLPHQILFMYVFFLASANLFGMAGSYFYEYQLRREFFTIQLLEKEKSNVEYLNMNLGEKVKERTRELEELNSQLEKNNTKLNNTQKELSNHKATLEETIEKRTLELQEKVEELEKYNQLFVGREFRIKELKDKIKKLESKIKSN